MLYEKLQVKHQRKARWVITRVFSKRLIMLDLYLVFLDNHV